MPEYRIGEKIEESAASGMPKGQSALHGESSEVTGRLKGGLIICPYCYSIMWCEGGWGYYYICQHCLRDFK